MPVACVVVTIPWLRTVSEMNSREHWRARHRRKLGQQALARTYLNHLGRAVRDRLRAAGGIRVTFVRLGGRRLDRGDNLNSSFKHVRDELARWLGVDDGSDWYEWAYSQEQGGEWGVRIQLEVSR